MNLDEAIDRYTNNAEYERTHGSLHGCLEFKQLAEWLKDYKRLLEQQPCEDAISRQAVEDAIYDYSRSCDVNYAQIMEYIDKLPPVKQEPKTGHREYNDIYDHYLCGNCKTIVMDYDNFCPNCGAKMESEE